MKILFTGTSSFTGYWFVRELVAAGHRVVATFRQRPEQIADALRRRRVEESLKICTPLFGVAFGDDAFVDAIRGEKFDLLCHHAADVTHYKSPDFDVLAAVRNNTHRLDDVLKAFAAAGGSRVLLTGSVFENEEGRAESAQADRPAFSPYGLSKAITAQMFHHYAPRHGLHLGKFVIPNPFGPMEEPRFTSYLVKHWFAGKTPSVATPDYVRDNIHVSLLARSYAAFAAALPASRGFSKINPSGYPESQGAFATRFAVEVGRRLGIACNLDLKAQTDFAEPMTRVNTDPAFAPGWNESAAWDELAAYYRAEFAK